jgi:hypothetical protein
MGPESCFNHCAKNCVDRDSVNEAFINARRLLGLGALMLLSLWIGYAIGYGHGVQEGEDQWWASARLDLQGDRIFPDREVAPSFDSLFVRQNPIPEKLR